MILRIIKSYRYLVTICDSELIGKKFEDGNFQLDIKENFYRGSDGQIIDDKQVIKIMKDMSREDATFNIVGKKSIDAALKSGVISKEGVKEIQGIPFALILM